MRKYLLYIGLCCFLFFTSPAWSQTASDVLPSDVSHPPDTVGSKLTGQRVMQVFDFEERDIHFETIPMYWQQVLNPRLLEQYNLKDQGFPHYSSGKLDTTFHRSGKYSFMVAPDGGNVGFEYHRRRIRAKPGSDFQITGFVHLEQGGNCRAQLGCILTDRLGEIIPASLHVSQPMGQLDQNSDGWARLEVYMPGIFPEARYLTVSLWILQEATWNRNEQVGSRIFQKNVMAKCWFDDITIYQLPRVTLRTSWPGNVFDPREQPKLYLEVDGVGVLDYHVDLTVQAGNGQVILNRKQVLAGMEGEIQQYVFDLGELPAGRYIANLKILSSDTLVASRQLRFARLAPMARSITGSGQGFGVLMMDNYSGDWDTAIEMTRRVNAKRLKIPVWRAGQDRLGAIFSEKNFDRHLINLQKYNVQVVATFSEVPDELALKMNVTGPSLLDVLSREVKFWQGQVALVLARYARQVAYWQIGGESEQDQLWDPRIQNVVETMRGEFDKLVKDTVIAVPLNGMFEIGKPQLGTSHVALRIPTAIVPARIPSYLRDARRRGLDDVWTTLVPLDGADYNREQVLIDFAKRVAFARKGGAEAVFIDHPWTQRYYNARIVTEPTELFPVFRTLADQLGATRYLGEFELAPGVPALIFDRDGEGCLFTWNDNFDSQNGKEPAEIRMYLGENPEIIDLFGNSKPAPLENGLAVLRLKRWPVLLSNIDTRIAMLRASVELTPRAIDAGISRRRLKIRFVNPFDNAISGSLQFLLDEKKNRNWLVEPMVINYVLQPRQKFEREIIMNFPGNELGGEKMLDAFFQIDADRNYKIRSSIPFEIRLFGVDVNIFTRRINQDDLLIQQVVTNIIDEEVNLTSFVDYPDLDHREQPISLLQPGASITRNYLVRDARRWLGRVIRVGLTDHKGAKRINYHVEIN